MSLDSAEVIISVIGIAVTVLASLLAYASERHRTPLLAVAVVSFLLAIGVMIWALLSPVPATNDATASPGETATAPSPVTTAPSTPLDGPSPTIATRSPSATTTTPPPPPETQSAQPVTKYLSDLEPAKGNWREGGIEIAGDTYGRSIYKDLGGCVPESSTEYVLGKDWDSLNFTAGLDDNNSDDDSSAYFEIFADGRRVFADEIAYGKARKATVSVKNVLRLKLSATLRDGKRGYCGDTLFATWGDPVVSTESGG